jgi:hypothetical protein
LVNSELGRQYHEEVDTRDWAQPGMISPDRSEAVALKTIVGDLSIRREIDRQRLTAEALASDPLQEETEELKKVSGSRVELEK